MNMKRIVINFLLLNIFALAIGWILTDGLPQRVYVTAETAPGLVVQGECGRGCRFDGHGVQTGHFWIPSDGLDGDFILRRRAGASSAKILDVRIWSRLVFERRLAMPDKTAFGADGTIRLPVAGAAVGLSRVGRISVLGGELFLIALAACVCWLGGRSLFSRRTSVCAATAVAIAVALFCTVIVPFQTFLANQAEMNLPVGSLLLALMGRFVLVAFALAVLLVLSTRFAGAIYLLVASAFVLYEYMETGVLTIGCPPLNGDMTFYKNISRMAWDALVLPASFLIALTLYRFFPRSLVFLPLAVCIFGFSSLLDVRSSMPDFHSELAVDFKPKRQVVEEAVYSTNRNVLVYVLDAVATPFLQRLFCEKPDFVEPLDGFTCYTNNLGMYLTTVNGTAGMTTGKYFSDLSRMNEFMHTVYSKDSLLATYLDGKSAVFFNPGSFNVGVSVGGSSRKFKVSDGCVSPWKRRMEGQQPWNLLEIVRFRMVPFAGKHLSFVFTAGGWDITESDENESWTFPRLAAAPVSDVPMAFHWFHTIGMHGPYGITRTGVDDGLVVQGDAAKFNKLWYVWGQLVDLLSTLKSRGLYESSLIVVTADHGCGMDARVAGTLSPDAQPILLVHPPCARGALRYSNQPTSHSRLHDLLVRGHEGVLTGDEVDRLLRCDERYYSIPRPEEDGFLNVYVDATQRTRSRFEKSAGKDPLSEPIELNRSYSLCGGAVSDRPPVRTRNMTYFTVEGPMQACHGGAQSILQFRVPGKSSYRVFLDVNAEIGSEIGGSGTSQPYVIPRFKNHVRHDCSLLLAPDDTGIVTITFQSKDFVAIHTFKVAQN